MTCNASIKIIIDSRTASKHNKLLEIISEFELQNMVNDPHDTRTNYSTFKGADSSNSNTSNKVGTTTVCDYHK